MNRMSFCFLISAAIAAAGCARHEGIKTNAAIAAYEPEPNFPPHARPAFSQAEIQTDPHSGETVWAEESSATLIAGMDGELYEPYRPKTIENIQRALKTRGLYTGPVNGVLDKSTMKAIYEFQRMAGTLQVCGVPTPRTRRLLEQGSHTDPW